MSAKFQTNTDLLEKHKKLKLSKKGNLNHFPLDKLMNYKALLTDHTLFTAFRNGEQDAFLKIFQTFKKAIYIFTLRIINSETDAEDLTVEAFTRAWERRGSMENMAHVKNFLYVAARNSCINFLESRRRTQLELTPAIADEIDASIIESFKSEQLFSEIVEEIMIIVERMPRLRRSVFRMRYLEDRPVKEVADELGLTVQNVYWHSKEAMAQTRTTLAKKNYLPAESAFVLTLLIPLGFSGIF